MSILIQHEGVGQEVDSLRIQLEEYGDSKHPDTLDLKAILCNRIAVLYQGLDENQKARTYFLQAIEFTKERIQQSDSWSAQNNYDMAVLYQNLSIFEATMDNYEQSEAYINKSEKYYIRLKDQLSKEEYQGILSDFYETAFVRFYHSKQLDLAHRSLKKAMALSRNSPLEKRLGLQRMEVELKSSKGQYESAAIQARELLQVIDEKADKSIINVHRYLHGLLSVLYHGDQFKELIKAAEERPEYQNIETIKTYAASNPEHGLSSFLNNLFILSYARIKLYKQNGNLKGLQYAFQLQQLAFRLAEEQTLITNAEMLGSILSNPKNKVLGLLVAAVNLSEHDLLSTESIYQIIRTIDIYQSTRLHLDRISFTLNAENWKQQKEWKHELEFTNRKLDEAVQAKAEKAVVDSIRRVAFRISQDLKKISQKTKYHKILDEYRISREEFQSEVNDFVSTNQKTVLVYFYERNEEEDSVYILGFSPDTAFITVNPIEGNFTTQIQQLYQYNSRFLTDANDIEQQEFLNRKFYDLLIEPVEEQLKTDDLLIYPVDEMSYISFDALLDSQYNYLTERYTLQYTTSLYSLIRHPKKPIPNVKLSAFYPHHYGVDSLAFLRHAKKEVEEIVRMSEGEGYVGKQASVNAFMECANESHILHLASHSILNYERPYESFILFDEKADSVRKDNRLHAYEIFAKTFNSDLVILSSCNTANGEIEKGVGLVSLSNAFYFSGVPATVSSLWSAQDKSSSELMIAFYTYLMQGETKSKSLQKARLDYLKNADRLQRQPFFWANYVLYGSDQPIYEATNKGIPMGWWIFTGLGLMVLFYLYRSFKRSRAAVA